MDPHMHYLTSAFLYPCKVGSINSPGSWMGKMKLRDMKQLSPGSSAHAGGVSHCTHSSADSGTQVHVRSCLNGVFKGNYDHNAITSEP